MKKRVFALTLAAILIASLTAACKNAAPEPELPDNGEEYLTGAPELPDDAAPSPDPAPTPDESPSPDPDQTPDQDQVSDPSPGPQEPDPTPPAVDTITINGVEYRKDLDELDLSGLELGNGDIIPLSEMTALTSLELTNNQISDLAPLSGLNSLLFLFLESNLITDLTPLSGLNNLLLLDLYDNPITDWSPVAHIESVEGRP
jgi:Leucine-rich repeat (LRR) protein